MKKKDLQEGILDNLQKWRNVLDSCTSIWVCRQTFYNRIKKDEKFADQVRFAMSNLERQSKNLIYNMIVEKKDISMAKRYLEKKWKDSTDKAGILDSLSVKDVLDEVIDKSNFLVQDIKN